MGALAKNTLTGEYQLKVCLKKLIWRKSQQLVVLNDFLY